MATLLLIRFDVWLAALASEYTPLSHFAAWADAKILADAHQPRWVLDVSLANDADQVQRILRNEWSRLSEFAANQVSDLTEPGSLHLGFLYLRFADGRMSMWELLDRGGRYTDCQGYGTVNEPCEAFFLLLNEIDGGGPTFPDGRPLAERVTELFAPYAADATAVLHQLPDRHTLK